MSKFRKYFYLDAMRVFAIFFVIFNHTDASGYFLFSTEPSTSFRFWFYLFISIFCRFAVPVFFMISGAVMLPKHEETMSTLWNKRILKYILILLIFSLIYYFIYLPLGETPTLHGFYVSLYSKGAQLHMWYLYAYIAYLIALPFLRSLAKSLDDQFYYYLIIIAIVFLGIVPSIDFITSHGAISMNNYLKPSWLLGNTVLYPLLGFFFHNKLDFKLISKKKILLMWFISVICIEISSYLTYIKGIINNDWTVGINESFHMSFAVITASTIFITFKYCFNRDIPENSFRKVIQSIASCTFGMYLIHVIIIGDIYNIPIINYLRSLGINNMIAALLGTAIIMMLSYIITLILSKIPIIRLLIGFK